MMKNETKQKCKTQGISVRSQILSRKAETNVCSLVKEAALVFADNLSLFLYFPSISSF